MKNIQFLTLLFSLCFISALPALASGMPSAVPRGRPEALSSSASQDAAPDNGEDNIVMIETESAIDHEGNVTMTLETADDVTLPVTITMKGSEGKLSFTISRNGQLLKMKPGAYRLTKVTDGNGKRLPSGAKLFIPEESGRIYFDFNKPKSGLEFQWIDIVKANTVFLLITAVCYYLYHRYLTVNKIK